MQIREINYNKAGKTKIGVATGNKKKDEKKSADKKGRDII